MEAARDTQKLFLTHPSTKVRETSPCFPSSSLLLWQYLLPSLLLPAAKAVTAADTPPTVDDIKTTTAPALQCVVVAFTTTLHSAALYSFHFQIKSSLSKAIHFIKMPQGGDKM